MGFKESFRLINPEKYSKSEKKHKLLKRNNDIESHSGYILNLQLDLQKMILV